MNKSSPPLAAITVPATPEPRCEQAPDQGIDFGAVFEAPPGPTLVLSPQFTILAVNAAYLSIVVRNRTDLVGRNIFDAFPDNPNVPHADGVANLRASLQRVISTARVDRMAVQKYDVATEVGSGVYLPRYWKPMNTPVLNSAGEVRFIIHSVEEMTAAYLTEGRSLRGVLANLTDRIRDLKTPEEIGYEAAAILGEAFSASRVGYGTIDHVSDTLIVGRDWCAPGVETLAGETALRDYGSFIDDLKLGKFIAIANVDDDPRTAPAADALRARSAASFVNVPVIEEPRPRRHPSEGWDPY